jgi:hypothetical protein
MSETKSVLPSEIGTAASTRLSNASGAILA